ncbi:MAG: hypothetical protein ACOX3V_00625 [Bacillota bacterium]|jgi:hypothetical protein
MDNQRTLSEIARTLVLEHAEQDGKSLREKAGLLALLNLLGILDTFFGDGLKEEDLEPAQTHEESTPKPNSEIAEIQSVSTAAIEPSGPTVREGLENSTPTASLFGSLAKVLGASSGGDGTSSQGLDPTLIGLLLSLATNLPKLMKPKTSGATGDVESKEGADAKDAGVDSPAEKPAPLQQILGFDPKILTLILNLLAGLDIMKPKSEAKTPPNSDVSETIIAESHKQEAPATSSPRSKPRSRLHKPGLGIYRNWPGRPQLAH